MKPFEMAIMAFILILFLSGIVILYTSYKCVEQNEHCFYSADSMVIQFETQRIRHLKDVKYCLYEEEIVVWTELQLEFGGRIDDVEIFHVYNKAKDKE